MQRAVSTNAGQWPYALGLSTFLSLFLVSTGSDLLPEQPPNILFIVADDLGFNDVSWNNPAVKTPHMSLMANQGVILDHSYTQAACTPSRAAYLTGYYPFRIGVQNAVVREGMEDYVPLDITFLPQRLKEAGYSTHLVGKWHLGHCRRDATPKSRGFDSFLGVLNGYNNYYTKKLQVIADQNEFDPNEPGTLYDFFHDYSLLPSPEADYTTDIFTNRTIKLIRQHKNSPSPFYIALHYTAPHWPLQAPQEYLDQYANITDVNRQTYLAMVTAMDDGIGKVMEALRQELMENNTVIFFQSDNGGSLQFGASNAPLRGEKTELYEGGTRVPAFAYSPTLIHNTPRTSHALFHMVDWFSTILGVAGVPPGNVDGVDQWGMLRDGSAGERRTFIYNINGNDAAIRAGRFKLIEGNATHFDARRRRRSIDGMEPTTGESTGGNRPRRACDSRRPLESDLDKALRAFNGLTGVGGLAEVRARGGWTVDSILNHLMTVDNDNITETHDCSQCQLYDLKEDPSETQSLVANHTAVVMYLHGLLQLYQAEEVDSVLHVPYLLDPRAQAALADNLTSNTWCEHSL